MAATPELDFHVAACQLEVGHGEGVVGLNGSQLLHIEHLKLDDESCSGIIGLVQHILPGRRGGRHVCCVARACNSVSGSKQKEGWNVLTCLGKLAGGGRCVFKAGHGEK